jgi:uridine phosphorylase
VIDFFHILLLLFAKANIQIHPASSTMAVSKKFSMPHIPESELIVNPDGRIYHLALHPDELAKTVITVGDPGRVERVSSHFDRVDVKITKREFVTHTGWLGGKRITVISTGIGPDNIDIVLNELDALVNIDFQTRQPKTKQTSLDIVRIGTTGSLQPDLPVDQFLISRYGVGLDNLLHFYEYQPTMPEAELYDDLRNFMEHSGKLPAEPYIFEASGELADAIAQDYLRQGITLTCPGFYAPQGRELRAKSRLALKTLQTFSNFRHKGYHITNFEMETAAIFGLARILGHRALSCNAVLANRLDNTFSQQPKKTVDALIKLVLDRIVGL